MRNKILFIPLIALTLPTLTGCLYLFGYYDKEGLDTPEKFFQTTGIPRVRYCDSEIHYDDYGGKVRDEILKVDSFTPSKKKAFKESESYLTYVKGKYGSDGGNFSSTFYIYDNGHAYIKERAGFDYEYHYFQIEENAAQGIIDFYQSFIAPYQTQYDSERAKVIERCTIEELFNTVGDESLMINVGTKEWSAQNGFKDDDHKFLNMLKETDFTYEGTDYPIELIYGNYLSFNHEPFYFGVCEDLQTVCLRLLVEINLDYDDIHVYKPTHCLVVAKYTISEEAGKALYNYAYNKVK